MDVDAEGERDVVSGATSRNHVDVSGNGVNHCKPINNMAMFDRENENDESPMGLGMPYFQIHEMPSRTNGSIHSSWK